MHHGQEGQRVGQEFSGPAWEKEAAAFLDGIEFSKCTYATS